MRKIRIIFLIGVVCLLGGCYKDINNSKKLTQRIEGSMHGIKIEQEQKLTYSRYEADLFIEALSCELESAESILWILDKQNIGNLESAELLDGILVIKDRKDNTYILHLDKNLHLYAIQKDGTKGEYIYQELE